MGTGTSAMILSGGSRLHDVAFGGFRRGGDLQGCQGRWVLSCRVLSVCHREAMKPAMDGAHERSGLAAPKIVLDPIAHSLSTHAFKS